MKLGDLFTKLWYCTNIEAGIRPLCTPDDPHAEGVVCGFRWTAKFIPEDFERMRNLALIDPQTIRELDDRLNSLGAQIQDVMFRQTCADLTKDWDVDEGLKKILEEG